MRPYMPALQVNSFIHAFKVVLLGALLGASGHNLLGAQGLPSAQGAPGSPSGPLVPEDTNAYYRQHKKEGRLWFDISFGMVDRAHKKLTLGNTGPREPGFWMNSRCTLIFEYITESGKVYRTWALKPFGDGSTALVPTDESGVGFRVYTKEGELIGEYWAAGQKASLMVREDHAESWDLGWLDGGRLGFPPSAQAAKHFMAKPSPAEGGFGTDCYLRWSWDGGHTWGSARTWENGEPWTGPDSPDDRKTVAWNVPKAKLEKASDPMVELVVVKGLKITRRSYRIQDLPKHADPNPVPSAPKPIEVPPKPNQVKKR